MSINSDAVGRTIAKGARNAGALDKNREPSRTAAADIWAKGEPPPSPTQAQISHVKNAAAQVTEAEGALATAAAAMGTLTAAEQAISAPLAAIPFPRFPALRVGDLAVGLPHAHAHPPNWIPPAPPVPLPSVGPVIKIPILSGANAVFINGQPAARCGDMGIGVWCGGYFPLYEIFLGSSHVWIEGSRAARLGIDITKHCVFTTPKPQDPPIGPMVGTTITGSANVLIGGIPLPSLTNMAVGAALKVAFKGLGKVVRALRPAERAAKGLAVFRRAARSAAGKAISLRQLRMKLGRAGVETSGYAFRKATAEEIEAAGKRAFGWVNVDGAGRVFSDAKGRPIINFTDKGLSSLEEGVKTFGHEASHIKDYVAGIKLAREDVAEKAAENLWEKVSGKLERRNR
jgi:uncharacterized Zn-binding protein involved in type VI secretion